MQRAVWHKQRVAAHSLSPFARKADDAVPFARASTSRRLQGAHKRIEAINQAPQLCWSLARKVRIPADEVDNLALWRCLAPRAIAKKKRRLRNRYVPRLIVPSWGWIRVI